MKCDQIGSAAPQLLDRLGARAGGHDGVAGLRQVEANQLQEVWLVVYDENLRTHRTRRA